MEHVTTPETAQRLKDAGFLQPEFKTGQFWYNLFNAPTLVGKSFGKSEFMCHSIESGRSQRMQIAKNEYDVFAPTATDILRELGKSFVIYYDDTPGINMWFCAKIAIAPQDVRLHLGHINPAEAAALAWLDKHENSSTK